MSERDTMEYRVVVVGGGPAGLAAAIRLKQLDASLSVCLLEKGSSVGVHSFSGAVLEPGPLDALLPQWRAHLPATCVAAKRDEFKLYTRRGSWRLPVPPLLHNVGNFIVSLGQLTAWLKTQAEALGVDVFEGYAGSDLLYEGAGTVRGVRVGDMGVEKSGQPGPNHTLGPDLRADLTLIAEGCRGSLAKQLIAKHRLDRDCNPQVHALGFKELWELPPGRTEPGLIVHGLGFPLDNRTYGGSFIYHLDERRVYVGYVVGLDYADPRFAPFEAFQQYKHHPEVKPLLAGGTILSAGARAISAGGWQSTPKLEAPGALLIGDAGGTLNFAKIKGIHQAIRSGVLAAEHYLETGGGAGFDARWRASPGGQELRAVRNMKPGFKRGLWFGLANAALEWLSGGRTPWTLKNHASHSTLKRLDQFDSPERGWVERELPPRDRLASVYFAATSHEENQPVHLKVADTSICATRCAREYGNPCTRFCPANVYEMIDDGAGGKRLQINAANCVHCKACDIKDPYQIIDWVPPEGGSGPNYQAM